MILNNWYWLKLLSFWLLFYVKLTDRADTLSAVCGGIGVGGVETEVEFLFDVRVETVFNHVFRAVVKMTRNLTSRSTNFVIKIYYLKIFHFCKWILIDGRI